MTRAGVVALLATMILGAACGRSSKSSTESAAVPAARPSILLVTLDTTRADSIGPEAAGIDTPAFNAIAARGRRFRQAYATVPETLPSHSSMMTGLYPAAHGVHENGRYLGASHAALAERLHQAGYRTAACVSSFALARRFGLSRGFDVYDDELPAGRAERSAREVTDAAVARLRDVSPSPLLLWVHYYDPHAPYTPPEPYRARYAARPYFGEIAAMDEQLGRLVQAFQQAAATRGGPPAIIVVGDHGEGLGEHGEAQHGTLLYQSTVQVPLVIAGPGITPGVSDTPVSARRVFHTILDWAGLESANSFRGPDEEVVLGEAMKPFLEYGWQPQVMAILGRRKWILAGALEVHDVAADPAEARDLAGGPTPPPVSSALRDYPIPSPASARGPGDLDADARRKLASLGYVGASSAPVVRKDAPRPASMSRLFDLLDRASGLFVREQYAQVIPLLETILSEDPHNLDTTLRLATAHSSLGHETRAIEAFNKASELAPGSADVRAYLALHYARGKEWERAAPLLEQVAAEAPERLPVLEALAVIRERQGRVPESIGLRQKIYALRSPRADELVQLGYLAMRSGQTALAIESFDRARQLQGQAFAHDLELGVLLLAARRLEDARTALDRVPPSHPDYAMALFKRAQVSVLLKESDQTARIDLARRRADATTRELIAKERLFQTGR